MKQPITELIFILDASGSMQSLTDDTIGGVNSVLTQQKQEEKREVFVTTVLFNTKKRLVHDRVAICDVPLMDKNDYFASGGTALLDAVGETLEHIKSIHHYIRKEDLPERTLVVIMTDGQENASCRYGYEDIKSMIGERQEKGWEFLFLAANIDAAEAAMDIGIARGRAVNWMPDAEGEQRVFACLSRCVSDFPRGTREDDLAAAFAEVEEDFRVRGGKKR